jgi:hypothetical protein
MMSCLKYSRILVTRSKYSQYTGTSRVRKLPDSLTVGLCARNTPSLSEKKKSHVTTCVHYKQPVFVEVNKLFKRLTIIVDDENVSVLLLNNSVLIKTWALQFMYQ